MKSDYDIIIREFSENNDLTIYPISDLHIGAREFMRDKWDTFVKKLLSVPNSFITVGGDMMNNGTRSSVSNIFEETMRPADQKKWLAEQLAPIKEKILCAVCGNHERRSEKDADDNPLYDVMCKMDIEDIYRENVAFVKLRIGKADGDGRRNPTYTIAVTHGAGGGIYTGAAVNRNERFSQYIEGLDCLIVGHTHKGAVTRPQRLVFDPYNNRITVRDGVVISSTSWMSYGGYAMQKMLAPASNKLQSAVFRGGCKEMEAVW